jgi:hypothetical protein
MNRASTGFKLMKEVKKQLKKEENRQARVLKQAQTLSKDDPPPPPQRTAPPSSASSSSSSA